MFDFLIRPFRRNFGIDKEYYRFVDDMFGFIPHNIELYKLALIHKSASQSIGGHHINNERLEFLGDAVIESVTSDYLYIEFPDKNEGFMTQLRAKIVSRQSLNDIAHKIGLDKYVVYNSGGNFTQKHIYGDAFEAMMGAVYLDQGYEFVNRLLINNIFYKHLSIDTLTESETDFKSRLIEWCQKNRHSVVFRTRSDAHAPHTAPSFYSTVLIDGIEVGHGVGDSKKVAEQNAAASLSHEISDEECAELLDKFDKITPTPAKKEKVANTEKHTEKGVTKGAEKDSETSAPSQPKRSRRPKKAASVAEAVDTTTASEVTSKPESTEAAEKPKKSRNSRRTKKPAAQEATEATSAAETTPAAAKATPKSEKSANSEKAETAEKSDKRKRSSRPRRAKKSDKPQTPEKSEGEAISA